MAVQEQPPIRVPKQDDGSGSHGTSGYRGNVEVYEPEKPDPDAAPDAAPDADAPEDDSKSRVVGSTKARAGSENK